MLAWAIRLVTFIINSLLLTGFALIFTWLGSTDFYHAAKLKLRGFNQIILTIGFLVLFHAASELRIMQQHYITGYGWNYLNFQIGVIMFAVLFKQGRWLLLSLTATLFVWYWWLPNVTHWPIFFAMSVLLMWAAGHFNRELTAHRWLYYPFSLLFALPFMWANLVSLRGIDVGWWWEIGSSIAIDYLIWIIQKRLKQQHRRRIILMQEANTDNLTHLNNFRVFNEDLMTAFKQYQTQGVAYLVYTFDIDHFKHVNDQYGHLEGNVVLERVATQLGQLVKGISTDAKAYRIGGEEFSFIVFDRNGQFEETRQVANNVRKSISELAFMTKTGEKFQITVSLGQADVLPEDQNYMEIYRRADQQLYRAKEFGRNRVSVLDD